MRRTNTIVAVILMGVGLAAVAETAKEKTPAEVLAAARKERLEILAPTQPGVFEATPNADGAYVYEATSAQSLVKGVPCQLESDKIVKGLSVVKCAGVTAMLLPDQRVNAGAYWTLGNIKAGAYWIGVVYAGEGKVATYGPLAVYLNGRIVQLATQANPVQVAPGKWFIEALAGSAEVLQPGDEISVTFSYGGAAARLILHGKAPEPVEESPWRVPYNFGGHQWNQYTALSVNAEGRFLNKDGAAAPNITYNAIEQAASSIRALKDDTGKVTFRATLANPLAIAVTVDYTCRVKTFYGETVAEDKGRLTLPPHDQIERLIPFAWQPGELTHFADIVLLGVKSPDLSNSREQGGLGWPRHEALTFFPGHRQTLPWPDPFNARVVRRITISEPYEGLHQVYGLDRNAWEMGYTTELEPPMPVPAEIAFQRVNIPKGWHYPNLNDITPRPHGAYFRTTFTLPDGFEGRSFRLLVDYVYDEGTAYVNGQKTGNVRGDGTPLICDITRAAKPGTNELVIVVRDLIAIMNPDYVTPDMTVGNPSYLDAPGLHGKDGLGLGSVSILSAPLVSSEDVFVATSVRKKQISARITAANRGSAAVRVRATAEVLDDGKPILTLGEKELTLLPHEPVGFTLETAWDNPRLWGPGNPHLYAMAVTLTDVETGRSIDVRRERFGFRESWIDGPNIMFNGQPIKPVGYGPLIRFSPKGNFNFIRGGGRDWLDEVGILAYRSISGVYNTSSQHNVDSEKFWKAAEENNLAALRLLQNSPHILAWDLSNEWLCFLQYSVNDTMAGARRFKHLSDVVRAYDPTRWTLGNGEGDFNGLLDNYSGHYMSPYFDGRGAGMRGHSAYLPDGAFWRELDRHFVPGQDIVLSPFHKTILRPDQKVIMDNEFLWKVGYLMPPGPSNIAGEDDVVSPAVDSSSGPIAWMWKTYIDGHRDMGMSTVNVYSFHPGVTRGGFLEQTFIVPENQRRGYAGTTQSRRFTLINGRFSPCRFSFRWALVDGEGKSVAQGREDRRMISGELQRGDFSFDLPLVAEKTPFTLKAELESDGEFVCGEEWDIMVWPSVAGAAEGKPDPSLRVGALARRVFVFDPSGETAERFEKLGVALVKLDALAAPDGAPGSALLIIGENALDENSAKAAGALADFVDAGGRVWALAQTVAPGNLPVVTRLAPNLWSSQVFVRAGSHPILKGFQSCDLHFWQPDRAASRGAYTKPEDGNVIVLADSGNGESGLEFANLMEVFRGQGSYLLCQLPLIASFGQEPMAMEMLTRTLAYLGGEGGFKRPVGTAHVLTAPDSGLASTLKASRVEHRIIAADAAPESGSIYILDAAAARQLEAPRLAAFAACLRDGATVAVVNAAPGDQAWLGALAGVPVSVGVQPYPLWDGRGYRKGWSDYTAGLSQIDLYWKRYSSAERDATQAEWSDNIIEPFQDYAVAAAPARELIFPGALVELRVGSGVLLIDQRRWCTQTEALLGLAARNVAALMTAMNVAIAPIVQPRELPQAVDYKTIDLRPLANRALLDEVAEDGKGGWVDQGPHADLRSFPTGKQSFKGVPFDIGEAPNSCIVLASNARPNKDGMPKSVEIPVGFPAEGFFFLHGSAYTGDRLIANYRIQYEDGTYVDIPIVGKKNINDWAGPSPLNNEQGTRSVVAWTGSNNVFPLIGVYRMLWVNEKPDVPVKSIVFSTPELRSVMVLLGLTAAVQKGQFAPPPEDVARARRLIEEGRAAFADGRLDEARTLSQAALALDPSQADVYQVLANIAEKKGDDDWMLEAYRAWIYSGPRTPMPYNRIAEILEKRKDFKGALENYRESLKTEWNQPPVIEAVRRLEGMGGR